MTIWTPSDSPLIDSSVSVATRYPPDNVEAFDVTGWAGCLIYFQNNQHSVAGQTPTLRLSITQYETPVPSSVLGSNTNVIPAGYGATLANPSFYICDNADGGATLVPPGFRGQLLYFPYLGPRVAFRTEIPTTRTAGAYTLRVVNTNRFPGARMHRPYSAGDPLLIFDDEAMPNGSQLRACPSYCGAATLHLTSTAGNCLVSLERILPPFDGWAFEAYPNVDQTYIAAAGNTTPIMAEFQIPPWPCQWRVFNGNAGAQVIRAYVTAHD